MYRRDPRHPLPRTEPQRTSYRFEWLLLLVLILAAFFTPPLFFVALLSSLAPNILAALLTKEPPFQLVFGVAVFGLAVMYQTSTFTAEAIHIAMMAQVFAFFAVGLNELLFGERAWQAMLGMLISLDGVWIASWIALS